MTERTYAGHALAEIKAAAEAATPGPWQIITDEHPHFRGGKHIERRVFTTWKHPQLDDFAPVVNGSVGIPSAKGEKPIHMVSIEAKNASHIATANPTTVLAMAVRIEELERDSARYRWILQQAWFQEAFDRFDPDDGGMQDKFEKCVAEIADAAMEQTKNREGA